MDVLFLSPHYPVEMQQFTRGLTEVGARVWGVGDTPEAALPPAVRERLSGYLQVPRIMDEDDLIRRVQAWLGGRRPDRVEALWEPLVLAAARLRELLGVEGMGYDAALGFRDKGLMKERVAAAGLRVPRARRVRTEAETLDAAREIGFPVVFKPIAGAGSAKTFRVDTLAELQARLPEVADVAEASVEEYIDGDEFTFDAICIDDEVVYENIVLYVPRPIVARHEEWISPAQITIRDLEGPYLAGGRELGRQVIRALGRGTGFVHMEWFRNSKGEAVLGEIGARSGGGHLVDQMNFTSDIDVYREWARVVCWKSFEADATRKYNCAAVFKRAIGKGLIRRVDNLDAFKERWGDAVCWDRLAKVGEPRRDWRNTLVGDGFLMFRHPEWRVAWRMMEEAVGSIRLVAS